MAGRSFKLISTFAERSSTIILNCFHMRQKEVAEELAANPSKDYPIVCDNLKRVYPARDGNPPKYAVRGFSLAVPRGECFGILGPNGAGKTSSINMVPSSLFC